MSNEPITSSTYEYDQLEGLLAEAADDAALFHAIVDTPFQFPLPSALLFLGIVVFLQVNKAEGTIDRIALSKTEMAKMTTNVSAVPFHEIKIPLDFHENIIAHAIETGEPADTTDWKYLFEPAMAPEQARINQANAGIAYSAVYPLKSRDGGALIFSYYQYQHAIGEQQVEFMTKYTSLVDDRLAI